MLPDVPDDLRSFLRREALLARDTSLDDARAVALRSYQGELYGDEEEGRSQAVTRDVAEVIDTMLVGVLGTIMAGGKAVEFDTEPEMVPEPTEQNPEATRKVDYGAEATAAVQYQFFRRQKGYRIIHDVAKAGMLEKTGVVKTYAFPQRSLTHVAEVPGGAIVEEGGALTIDGAVVLSAEPVNETEALLDPVGALHRVEVEVPQPRVVRDVPVPNEWFLIAADAVDLDEAAYVGDKRPVSISDLVEMGFDRAEIEPLWAGVEDESVVKHARDAERSQNRDNVNRTGVQRQLWLHHEFPLWDLDGDGIAERLDVWRIGQHIIRVEPADQQPYSGWTAIPMAHRFTGQSVADKVMDIQRIRSVLLRQSLDSIYLSNAPRTAISETAIGDDTIDDLLNVRAGALIRYKGNVPPTPLRGGDTSSVSFQAMEMMSAERESRTGVTRQSQGMNPDTTNKTASGMAMLQANADQIELYVTRNLAEMLLLPMFGKRYRLMRQHTAPFRMKIDGKYVEVDPSRWPDEPDMQINVGLGTGNKDQRLAYRRELMSYQAEALGAGLRIVSEQEAYNSLRGFIEDASLGVPSDYVLDPSTLPPPGEKPDPAMAAEQSKAMIEAEKVAQEGAKAERADQLKADQLMVDREVRLADVGAKERVLSWEAEQKATREAQRQDAEAALAVRRLEFDMALATERAQFDMALASQRAKSSDEGGGLPAYRPGGDLDK